MKLSWGMPPDHPTFRVLTHAACFLWPRSVPPPPPTLPTHQKNLPTPMLVLKNIEHFGKKRVTPDCQSVRLPVYHW